MAIVLLQIVLLRNYLSVLIEYPGKWIILTKRNDKSKNHMKQSGLELDK